MGSTFLDSDVFRLAAGLAMSFSVAIGAMAETADYDLVEPGPSITDFRQPWGPSGRANTRATVTKYRNGKVAGKAFFDLDEFGRRIIPQPPDRKTESVLFFGNSETLGDVLEARDTIPALFAQKAPFAQVYNYAFQAHGPHQMLLQSQLRDFKKEVNPTDKGWIIYVLFENDLHRALNDSRSVAFGAAGPSFAIGDDGTTVFEGSFEKAHPYRTRFYRWFDAFLPVRSWNKWSPKSPIYLPLIGSAERRLLCRIFEDTAENFRRRLPGLQMAVLNHPRSAVYDEELLECLKKAKIRILDYRDLYRNMSREALAGPDNNHLGRAAHVIVADKLAQDLVEGSVTTSAGNIGH